MITQILPIMIPLVCLMACSGRQSEQHEPAVISDAVSIAAQPAKDSFARGRIIEQVVCNNDATQSYALYIPAVHDEAMPVIYFFDPHADGALPLQHYQALADAYHYILIGSNNSKNGNGWEVAQSIWNSLFTDTQNRFPHNGNRLYTCGFSGGAKVASYITLHQSEIKGVIAAGAGLPDGEPVRNFSFSFTGMAGRGDMNMTDLVALNSGFNNTSTRHRLILFDGKHAWPPADIMRMAFTGLQLDAMYSKQININDSLIQAFITESKQRIDRYITADKLVEAEQACALSAGMLNGLPAASNWFVKKESAVTGDPGYSKQLQVEQQLFTVEQNSKQTYQQQFQQGDIPYWTATINDLFKRAKAQTAEGAMCQRLLAYLSLAFYSISNQLIQNNQNGPAQQFVTLYKMADGTNSEAWYFSAQLNARSNNAKAAEDDLQKAAGYGFTDTTRMLQQPEFQPFLSELRVSLMNRRQVKAKR